MSHRAGIILIDNDQIALIKRVRDGRTYYVFPGGGIEKNETQVEAARRETKEELGLEVAIGPCLYELTGEVHEYYFEARIIGGRLGTGEGEEFLDQERGRGTYEPVWMPLEKISGIVLYPEKLAAILRNDT